MYDDLLIREKKGKNNGKNNVKKYGTDFMENLALLCIAFKLCGVIHIRWLWVLCPLWAGGALIAIGFALIVPIRAIFIRRNRLHWNKHHNI